MTRGSRHGASLGPNAIMVIHLDHIRSISAYQERLSGLEWP